MVSKTPFLGEDREGGRGGGTRFLMGRWGENTGRSYIVYEASSGPIRGELNPGFSLFVQVTPSATHSQAATAPLHSRSSSWIRESIEGPFLETGSCLDSFERGVVLVDDFSSLPNPSPSETLSIKGLLDYPPWDP